MSSPGLAKPSAGTIRFEGKPVAGEVPDGVGVVFQEDASFPWLTVYDNAAFALRRAGVPDAEVRERVEQHARLHRPCVVRAGLSGAALRRHAPAAVHRAHLGDAPAHAAARRAVRRARPADAAADGRRTAQALARDRRHRPADHPFARRGRAAVRPHRRDVGAARRVHRSGRDRMGARSRQPHRVAGGVRRGDRRGSGLRCAISRSRRSRWRHDARRPDPPRAHSRRARAARMGVPLRLSSAAKP